MVRPEPMEFYNNFEVNFWFFYYYNYILEGVIQDSMIFIGLLEFTFQICYLFVLSNFSRTGAVEARLLSISELELYGRDTETNSWHMS